MHRRLREQGHPNLKKPRVHQNSRGGFHGHPPGKAEQQPLPEDFGLLADMLLNHKYKGETHRGRLST